MAWVKSVRANTTVLTEAICGHCNVVNWIAAEWSDDSSTVDDEGMTCWSCKKENYFHPYLLGEDEIPAENESIALGEGKESAFMALNENIRDAEICVLREINSHLFWLATQGDYSNPAGELLIRAAKEGKTTAESARAFIASCEERMDTVQEYAEKRCKESREMDQYFRSLSSALRESLKLQSHYAKLLNTHDGGERIMFESFDCVDQWMKQLGHGSSV